MYERHCLGTTPVVVLDLSEVNHIGSLAIGRINSLHKRLAECSQRLVLIKPRGEAAEILHITGLDTIMECHDSLEQALEACGCSPADLVTILDVNEDDVEKKIERLNSPNPEIRCYAAWSLGLLKAHRALPILERLKQEDPDAEVREAAAEAVESIRSAGGRG